MTAELESTDERETLLGRVESELQRPWSRITFHPAIEARYRRAIEPTRTRHYILCHLSGMVVFDLFVFVDALVIPDALALTIILDFVILTPGLLVLVWLMHRRIVPAVAASTAFLFPILLTMLGLMLASRAQNAPMIALSIPMVMVYASIALPLPVPQAAIVAVGATLLTAAAVALHPGFDVGGGLFAVLFNVSMAAYLMLATFRNEISVRRFYLLGLRDALKSQRLRAKNRELLSLTDTDGLTGIGNRRSFDARLEGAWRDTSSPVALLMIDIDHFKRINDTHGHLGGDACLRVVAEIVSGITRGLSATPFRYGGEEFAVLLTGPEAEQVDGIAERIRAGVAAASIPLPGGPRMGVGLTVSIGCAAMVADTGLPQATLISIADAALYQAKRKGRNRVQFGPSAYETIQQVA